MVLLGDHGLKGLFCDWSCFQHVGREEEELVARLGQSSPKGGCGDGGDSGSDGGGEGLLIARLLFWWLGW